MSNIEERVKKIVIEQLGVKEDEVSNSASLVDDLGYASDPLLSGDTARQGQGRHHHQSLHGHRLLRRFGKIPATGSARSSAG